MGRASARGSSVGRRRGCCVVAARRCCTGCCARAGCRGRAVGGGVEMGSRLSFLVGRRRALRGLLLGIWVAGSPRLVAGVVGLVSELRGGRLVRGHVGVGSIRLKAALVKGSGFVLGDRWSLARSDGAGSTTPMARGLSLCVRAGCSAGTNSRRPSSLCGGRDLLPAWGSAVGSAWCG